MRFSEAESDGLTKMQNDHVVLGTANYLSPEQALKSDDLNIRSDIYSLGVTFYYLLAGKTPFSDLNIAQKLLHHQFKDPPPLDHVPKDLFAVLMTMMAKKPGDRYQTPAEFAEAVIEWTRIPLPPPPELYFPLLAVPSATPSNVPRALTGSFVPPAQLLPPRVEPSPKKPVPIGIWIAVGAVAIVGAVVAAVLATR